MAAARAQMMLVTHETDLFREVKETRNNDEKDEGKNGGVV